MATVQIKFKDPDFDSELREAGVPQKTVTKLTRLAEFREYWTLEIEVDDDGKIAGGRFVRTQ